MLNLVLFTVIFLVVVNRFQIITFLGLVIGPKTKISVLKDKWIVDTIKKKTGLSLIDVTLFHDNKMYAMMAGLPFWPKMIVSTELYKKFTKDELEWVILHEAGHCVLWHNLQVAVLELLMLFSGGYLVWRLNIGIISVIIVSLLVGFICIQIIRWGIEYVADSYSINRIGNPRGVITAQEKFRQNCNSPFQNEKNVLRFLFHWNITPSRRIIMANRRLMSY